MNDQSFFEWLFSEAGAGWVFGIVTLIGLLLMLWRRKKPSRVVCKEVDKFSLVRIGKSARDKISILFCEESVENLTQFEAELSNEGSETIRDIVLEFRFPDDTKILDFSYYPVPENLKVVTGTISENIIKVIIPFLNPVQHHKHRVKVSAVCDGDIEDTKVIGGGEGWSVHLVKLPTWEQMRKRLLLIGIVGLIAIISSGVFSSWVGKLWQIDTNKVTPQSMLLIVPVLLVGTSLCFWAYRFTRRMQAIR